MPKFFTFLVKLLKSKYNFLLCYIFNQKVYNIKTFNWFKGIKDIENLELYKLYLKHGGEINTSKYERLIIKEDPLYTISTHYDKGGIVQKIPIDLWRYTKEFL